MATFRGTTGADTADATTGTLTGFTGGTSAELTDSMGDLFFGLEGDDRITAGSGDDILRGGLGADILRGGAGRDTVDYLDNFGSVFVNLYIGQGFGNAAQGDTYDGIENATGTIYADYLLGSAGDNVLDGNAGADFMIGFLGADTFIGGQGFDTVSYEDNAGSIFINLVTGRGYNNAAEGDVLRDVESVIGTSYADYFLSGSGEPGSLNPSTTTIDGREGNDYVVASSNGVGTYLGGEGEDTISIENGGLLVSLLDGRVDRASIAGFENVVGSSYFDTIIGDDGNNVIFGRGGYDLLTGNGGVDTFVFDTPAAAVGSSSSNPFTNIDRITDFTEFDQIYLDRNIFAALPYGELAENAFFVGAEAATAEHRIIYNQTTGALLYDSDGTGAAAPLQFAVLLNTPTIASTEFFAIG